MQFTIYNLQFTILRESIRFFGNSRQPGLKSSILNLIRRLARLSERVLSKVLRYFVSGLEKVSARPIILIFIFSFFIPLSKVHADFNLAVYPPIIQINAKPPANVSAPVTVENLGSESIELELILKPFEAGDRENGQIKYLEEIPVEYSLIFQRVAVLDGSEQITELTLGPKQKKELTLNINIPRETTPQDYYFSLVFVSSQASEQPDRTGTQILGGIATNILLTVAGEKKTEAVIQEFSAPLFIEKGPVPFTVRVKNTGNHYIAPQGEIVIKNLLGQTVGKVELLPVNILAGSVRSLPSTGETGESLWKEDFILGPYKAVLNLSFSNNGPRLSREIIFLAFPGISILAVIGSAIVLLYLFKRVRSKI